LCIKGENSVDKRTIRQTGIYDTREDLRIGVLRYLNGGKSVSETARLTGVSKGTVGRIKKGDHTDVRTEPYRCQAQWLNKFWKVTAS